MKERDLISNVAFTVRGVLKRWLGAYKNVKGIPQSAQMNEVSVHLFILWCLDTKGCPASLRRALQEIKDEWQEEAVASAKQYGLDEVHRARREAGLE